MIRQAIITILVLIPSLIITGLIVRWIKYVAPSVLGFELPDLAFVIFFVTSFSLVFSLVTRRLFRSLRETSKKELSQQRLNVSHEVSTPTSGQLILVRAHAYVDRLRAYQVFIDGSHVEQIADGEKKIYKLAPGSHEVTIRIDWCETKPTHFSVGVGETKNLGCGPNLDGVRFLMLPWYVTFGRHNYLWLKKL